MINNDRQADLQAQVQAAYRAKTALIIQGGGSKFPASAPFSRANSPCINTGIDLTVHSGIVEYNPSELVVVVRAGTPLKSLIAALAEQQQMLGFEPPFAGDNATVGGMVAAGFAGSARPYRGAVRDFILGAKIINGKGEVLQFGGKVMKNVAGFDLFRPMAGAMGTLGILLEVALRLVPKPPLEQIISLPCESVSAAIQCFTKLAASATSLSAAHWFAATMRLRFSGSAELLDFDTATLATLTRGQVTEQVTGQAAIFKAIDERRHAFFHGDGDAVVYRCDLPAAAPDLPFKLQQLVDWGGAQRFVKLLDTAEADLLAAVQALDGQLIKLPPNGLVSSLLNPPHPLRRLHQQIKATFDPAGILNPQWNPASDIER